ncbi:MAG: hypothetical protein US63_C0004G0015 [Candidatus Moranbacteria bacterium GW2011_GWC2_37_8]|nr:MAG: hypothetical protein US63_C0004G0015 [Candidatus Moranbacteria bacterium GW2011_GWC2_37_8]KKQ62565.1 MAG: hypothetical protein US82_C0009G0015 [Parcubacteria group bacterium GW2011_GWC1_38_22]KKQ80734.1 MAG: hypothetical protein UT03_C0019G0007 [Candidatus Moranbacteria bacterium GW2011_GWD2_38_7]
MDISNKKIIIATHYLVYGAPQALREYLIDQKVNKLLFIAHPLYSDDSAKSFCERINKSEISKKIESNVRFKRSIINYFFEFFLSLKWVFLEREKYDIWIGVDPLNALVGILLKKIGKIRKVIYYTIDYVPVRFANKELNDLYHWIDKLCVKNADETWNVSYRIAEGREKIRGLSKRIYANQKVVPIGVWLDRVKRLPFEQIKKHQLLFVGNLLEKQGVQLVLDAMPDILKEIHDFKFLIVGGGEYENVLKNKVTELNLENSVEFTGWIKERAQLDQIMSDSALAIAMYDKEKDNFTYYADPTKLKDYLSAGLPILLTDVPHNAHEIENNQCGKIISYNKDQISKTIIAMMKDEGKLREYRNHTIEYIKQFDWNIIFKKNL